MDSGNLSGAWGFGSLLEGQERGHAGIKRRGINSYISLVLDEAEHTLFVPMRELSTVYSKSSMRGREGYEMYIPHATAGARTTKAKGDKAGDETEEPKARRGMNGRPESEEEVKHG